MRRLILALAALLAVSMSVLTMPRETQAMEAWIEKGKTDCQSVELAITLTYSWDDTPSTENRDFFKLEVYDATNNKLLAHIEESITQEQSPFYWQTGRINGTALAGKDEKALYRIEMWDTDDKGEHKRRIDQIFVQCETQNTWRDDPVPLQTPVGGFPQIDCHARAPIYTTNGAPEPGAVIVQWTFGTARTDPEYHLQTIPVARGDVFTNMEIFAPCGTYLRLYFQPDSNKLLYYMPSQFWPHDLYGTADKDFEVGPIYHTFFPLDGPTRAELTATSTPTPAPTATLTPTP